MISQPSTWGVDLDAPAVKHVTIKSEIQRGHQAIEDTPFEATSILDGVKAIDETIDRDQQKNTDTDAFYLGAYFTAWLTTDMALDANADHPGLQNPQSLELARRDAEIWYKEFRKKEQQLGVDDRTLATVLGMKYPVLASRLDAWQQSGRQTP
jgi:hypothetical protein